MTPHRLRRAVIVAGGNVGAWALQLLRHDDYVIGADSGAAFLIRHRRTPDLALGDFDSVSADERAAIRAAAAEWLDCDAYDKNWTDTEWALREAAARGCRDIVLAGALGTRFDHSFANVQLLRTARELGCEATLVDERNEIRLCTGECRLEADSRFDYVSLLPLSPIVTGITLTGFRYPLKDATIAAGQSLGVSNVLERPPGTVSIAGGELLVIRSRD